MRARISMLFPFAFAVALSHAGPAEVKDVLVRFTDEMQGKGAAANPGALLAKFKANWNGSVYAGLKTEIGAYLAAYEGKFDPLFKGDGLVKPGELEAKAQITYTLKQWILDSLFVAGKMDQAAGIQFEEASVFPGAVKAGSQRVASVQIEINGSYATDPGFMINNQGRIIRPTGYFAPAGEAITVEVEAKAVNQGLRIVVGAHETDLTEERYQWTAYGRFPRIQTRFDIKAASTTVGNPFGGGLYIHVPDGSKLGWIKVTLKGAVQTPYFSARTGRKSDAAAWRAQISKAESPWIELESDKFMMTLPRAWEAFIPHPEALLSRWGEIMDKFSVLAGRPLERIRAEYFLVERQTPYSYTQAPADYPMSVGNHNLTAPNLTSCGTCSPTHIRTSEGYTLKENPSGLPGTTMLHEYGHLHNFPTLKDEYETNVNVPFVYVANTIYGLSLDSALKVSLFQVLDRDQSAVDWFISPNFSAGKRIGYDTVDFNGTEGHELRYQQRGYAKYVDIADMFGWETGMGAINKAFYERGKAAGKPINYIVGDDDYIRTASRTLGVNMAPLFEVWGIIPSAALVKELAPMPKSDKIKERLFHYWRIAPADLQEFLVYFKRADKKVDDYQQVRYDRLKTEFSNAYGKAIKDRILGVTCKYFPGDCDPTGVAAVEAPALRPRADLTFSVSGHNAMFKTPMAGMEIVKIFDLAGALIRTLPVDDAHVVWDKRDQGRRPLKSGLFFVEVSGPKQRKAFKLLL